MKALLSFLCISIAIASCEFNKSVNKDFTTSLFTKGDGLSSEDVDLSIDDVKIQRTTFTYGEKFFLNFSDMSGFKKDNDTAFPGMSLFVTNTSGDTVMQSADLYADNTEGYNISPLLLRTYLTVANPMHSGEEYIMSVGIWDKNGKGKFSAKLDFDVIPNAAIKVESNVPYDEIYLFSRELGKVVTDNTLTAGEDIYMLFEGLSGFVVDHGNVYPGLSLKVNDKSGAQLMNYEDLFDEHSENGIPESDLKELVSAQLSFAEAMGESQVQCEVIVWDKKGNGKVKAATSLTLN